MCINCGLALFIKTGLNQSWDIVYTVPLKKAVEDWSILPYRHHSLVLRLLFHIFPSVVMQTAMYGKQKKPLAHGNANGLNMYQYLIWITPFG